MTRTTKTMRTLACVSALALAAPAAAQTTEAADDVTSRSETGDANMMGQRWQDVVTPSVRFIQLDGQGNIVFDSAGENLGTGASDPALARQIDEADGETPFATDEARPGWNRAAQSDGTIDPEITVIDNEPSEQRQELAASPVPNRQGGGDGADAMARAATEGTEAPATGSAMAGDMSEANDAATGTGQGSQGMTAQVDDRAAPRTDGQYGDAASGRMAAQDGATGPGEASGGQGMMAQVDDRAAPGTDGRYGAGTGMSGGSAMEGSDPMGNVITTASGMQIDMDEFAREMFEQGYRRGYVSGLTEMRARAVRQMQDERQQAERAQYRQRLQEQSREQERAMDEVLDAQPAPGEYGAQMQRGGDGSTVIMLPPGVTPRMFMEMMSAQR